MRSNIVLRKEGLAFASTYPKGYVIIRRDNLTTNKIKSVTMILGRVYLLPEGVPRQPQRCVKNINGTRSTSSYSSSTGLSHRFIDELTHPIQTIGSTPTMSNNTYMALRLQPCQREIHQIRLSILESSITFVMVSYLFLLSCQKEDGHLDGIIWLWNQSSLVKFDSKASS